MTRFDRMTEQVANSTSRTERQAIIVRLKAIAGPEHPVVQYDEPDTGCWRITLQAAGTEHVEISHDPMIEEDDWSTGERRVIERPSSRPYRVDSPRYTRGKTFASLDSARKAFLHEAMAACMTAPPPPGASGPSGRAK